MADPKQMALLKSGVKKWNEWVEEQEGEFYANLNGAVLVDAVLPLANLVGADLENAKLMGAELPEADLTGADLTGADLTGARLGSAILSGAILRGARFLEADLIGADFRGAFVGKADFTGAQLQLTTFGFCNLSETVGLEEIRHFGPSIVGPDTLIASGGRLPNVFLRGVGWPERLIEYWPAISEQGIQFCSVFISYSSEDKVFARQLHDRLQGKGVRCWLDEKEILPGDDIRDRIDHGIRVWDKVILVCSEASLSSSWVDKEVERALQKEEKLWKTQGKRVQVLIPVRLDDFIFGWEGGKAADITSRYIADFRDWKTDHDTFEAEFERVVQSIRADDGARPPDPEPKI